MVVYVSSFAGGADRHPGADYAQALAAKDAGALRALLHPEIDFRGITPARFWEATGPGEVHRFSIKNPEGRFLVEQQAFLTEHEGRIGWMSLSCSGFRPV